MAASKPEGDPVVHAADPALQRETREPPENRHEELEEAEVPGEAVRRAGAHLALFQTDAQGKSRRAPVRVHHARTRRLTIDTAVL